MIIPNDSYSDRSELIVSLVAHISRIPGMFKDVTDAVCGTSSCALTIKDLRVQTRQYRKDCKKWLLGHATVLQKSPELENPIYDKFCKVWGTYWASAIISNRLLLAVSDLEAPEVEKETQSFANRILALQRKAKSAGKYPQLSLFLAQRGIIAQATIESVRDWEERGRGHSYTHTLIEKHKFERWCHLFHRRTTWNFDRSVSVGTINACWGWDCTRSLTIELMDSYSFNHLILRSEWNLREKPCLALHQGLGCKNTSEMPVRHYSLCGFMSNQISCTLRMIAFVSSVLERLWNKLAGLGKNTWC